MARILAVLATVVALVLPAVGAGAAPIDERLVVGVRGSGAEAALAATGEPVRRIPGLRAAVVTVGQGRAAVVARRLRRSGAVRYVEPEHTLRASDAASARRGDPARRDQWSLDVVGAPAAWTVTRGAGVAVAVIDTGVAAAPDLEGRLLPGWDALTHSPGGEDDNGHGTHVAATIAEVADNGIAGVGIAPEASILPVKVLDATGAGPDSAVAEGIAWAVDHGARVLNLSLGGVERSSVVADAVAYARGHDALVVAAAGNGAGPVEYPARFPAVLAVGAVDGALEPTEFTSRGRGLDLVAPGVGIVAQTLGDRAGSWSTRSFDGTSMAAPHVSAAAALVIASGRATKAASVAGRLRRTAQELGPEGWDPGTGSGLVRVDLAVGVA